MQWTARSQDGAERRAGLWIADQFGVSLEVGLDVPKVGVGIAEVGEDVCDLGTDQVHIRRGEATDDRGNTNHLLLVKAADKVPVRYFTGAGWNKSARWKAQKRLRFASPPPEQCNCSARGNSILA